MEIEYALTENDLMSVAMYQADHSPVYRRWLRNLQIGYAVGSLLFALGTWALLQQAELLLMFIAIGLLLVLFGPELQRWRLRRRIAQLYHDRQKRGLYSKRVLRVTPEGLEEVSNYKESRVKWSGVDNVVSTDTHTFILAGAEVIVIPKDVIEPSKYDAFVEAMRRHQSEAVAQPVLELTA